jgi:hypothetical protein
MVGILTWSYLVVRDTQDASRSSFLLRVADEA